MSGDDQEVISITKLKTWYSIKTNIIIFEETLK